LELLRRVAGIPFKGETIRPAHGQVKFANRWLSLWDSYGLEAHKIRAGNICEDARGRWYLNACVQISVPAPARRPGAELEVGIDLGHKELATLALCAAGLAAFAGAQAASDPMAIKAVAEIEQRTLAQGHETTKLVPADRVVPGDRVFYTLEVRNTGAATIAAPTVTYPIPDHMQYIADSAVGPATEVSFSVDGGRSFDIAEDLKIRTAEGTLRAAIAADYTHIRWQFKRHLKGNAVAFVRFRALVKS